jgi:hypothetical protein
MGMVPMMIPQTVTSPGEGGGWLEDDWPAAPSYNVPLEGADDLAGLDRLLAAR